MRTWSQSLFKWVFCGVFIIPTAVWIHIWCRKGGNLGDRLLYPWQAHALLTPGVLEGRNLVYCVPTSGGKSLVAEMLALRRLHITGKPILLVLPFVSLCTEKAAHWQKLLEPLGRKVQCFLYFSRFMVTLISEYLFYCLCFPIFPWQATRLKTYGVAQNFWY